MRNVFVIVLLAASGFILTICEMAHADALAKLKPEKLEATHQAVLKLKADWQKLDRPGPYKDYRANLHVHSAFSHDSRGKIEDIVAAAKRAGTSILMFSEHPADHYDFYKDGHRGMKDGVLLIPGAEMKGWLCYPKQSLKGLETGSPQEFSDLVRSRGGHMFVCHLEERMQWDVRGVTGNEIYNTHADVKDERGMMAAIVNPLWLLSSQEMFRKYPQECFSALLDYPAAYLKRWDQYCEKSPHTGVAGNDSHQNIGFFIKLMAGDKVRIEDALGKKVMELDAQKLPALQPLLKDKKEGDVVFQLRLDPYENSLRHVGTHLLLKEQTEEAVWEALEVGRAYVAFDWIADATGFDFAAESPKGRHEMGSRLTFEKDMKLHVQAPLSAKWKLIRNGKVVTESAGRTFDYAVAEPGNYRVEAWLKVAGEDTIWILSNPLYVHSSK